MPSDYAGKTVTTLAPGAFYGCTNLKRIHIGLTIRTLESGCFRGCISLQGIYLYDSEDGSKMSIPQIGLFDDCNRNVKVYILNFHAYEGGYTWDNYKDRFELFER